MASTLSKAKIVAHGKAGDKEIFVLFNPNQYSIDKSNTFASIGIPGRDAPIIQFVKGEAETLTMDLFLDTFETGEDVRKRIDEISGLMKIDKDLRAPPVCSFEWGGPVFYGVLERISKRFTMFTAAGVPVRATLGVTFKQFPKEEKNPKHSPDRTKLRVFKDGDSLWAYANSEYGDPSKWRARAPIIFSNSPLKS